MEHSDMPNRRPPVRRRRPDKMQILKEELLPVVIMGIAVLLILIFVIGSLVLNSRQKDADRQVSIQQSQIASQEHEAYQRQIEELLAEASIPAASYDYDTAIAILSRFKGDPQRYPQIQEKIAEYDSIKEKMVAWEDPSQVVNLSIQLLIADTSRAFNHSVYQSSFNRNFITTGEFSAILQQLYDNGYVLVNLEDIVASEVKDNGDPYYTPKTLYLPAGKKPLMLTQTNVNYNNYLVDGDGDQLPDKYGCGFANKLLLDENGEFTCEMVNANGETVTGAFDLVPILEAFIKEHPDFSYQGARAILALTGYNGLLGYRTQEEARELFGEDAYYEAANNADTVLAALRERGYTLACYTYENIAYGERSATEIQADLNDWSNQVVPIMGTTDILVYAQMSDISNEQVYSGDKYNLLQNYGFRYYIGFSENGTPWFNASDTCVRQGRIMVTGYNLSQNASWFNGIFDAAAVLDQTRPGF